MVIAGSAEGGKGARMSIIEPLFNLGCLVVTGWLQAALRAASIVDCTECGDQNLCNIAQTVEGADRALW
jgi:hypothetical protein